MYIRNLSSPGAAPESHIQLGCVKIQNFSGSGGFGATEISMGFPNARFGVVKNTDVPTVTVEAQANQHAPVIGCKGS